MTPVAAVAGSLTPRGGDIALWRRWDSGVTVELGALEAGVLRACATFATRDAHLAQLRRLGLPAVQASAVFDALASRGLIADFGAMMRARRALPADAVATSPGDVDPVQVIRSYERPAGLRRLLDSIAADCRRGARPRRVTVVDDTRDAGHAAVTRALVAEFAGEHARAVRYLGPAQRESSVARLADAAGVDATLLAGVLDPAQPSAVTGSRTWNWAVLLSAGGCLSILDDDTSFPLRLPRDAATTYDVADASEAMVTFFDDDAWADASPVPLDPYETLASWLVPDAGAALAAHGWRDDALYGRTADEFAYLLRPSPVLGVVPGLYGGIALDTAAHLLHPNPPTQASLWRPPYDPARLEANRLWHAYPHARFTAHAVYTPLLLDARAPLPFAGTWGRIDDTYFLTLLGAIAPDAAFAHVPAMLGHIDLAPRHRRERAGQPLLLDRNAWVANVLADAGRSMAGGDRWTRLRGVGERVAMLAAVDDAALAQDVLGFRNAMRGKLVAHLDDGLRRHPDAPAAWRADVERALASNRAAMRDEAMSPDEIALCRRALQQVVVLAPVWPAVWEAMRGDLGLRDSLAVGIGDV